MYENQKEQNPFKGTFGSLENLVDRISEVLNCPITIEDVNHQLLAYSTHSDRTDSARINTIIGRRVPEKVINSLWKDGILPKLIQSEEPLRIPSISEVGLSDRVAISIRKNDEILGYIWAIQVGHPLSDDQLLLLKKAAQTAKSQLLQLKVRKRKEEQGFQEFFWQLLTGYVGTHTEIKAKIQQFHLTPPSTYAILVFQFKDEITTRTEQRISYIISTTQQLAITFHVIDRRELILFATLHPNQSIETNLTEFIEAFILQMKKRFGIEHIKAGSGSIYDNFEKIEKSYQEALSVLRLKEQFPEEINDLFSYQQLGIYRYLDVIHEKNQRDGYENHSLTRLLNYDRTHKTQLVETLEAFLNKDSNVNEAAKSLHVHTNTLNYRLKRIAEIGNINFKDPNQKVTLFLDLKINKPKMKALL